MGILHITTYKIEKWFHVKSDLQKNSQSSTLCLCILTNTQIVPSTSLVDHIILTEHHSLGTKVSLDGHALAIPRDLRGLALFQSAWQQSWPASSDRHTRLRDCHYWCTSQMFFCIKIMEVFACFGKKSWYFNIMTWVNELLKEKVLQPFTSWLLHSSKCKLQHSEKWHWFETDFCENNRRLAITSLLFFAQSKFLFLFCSSFWGVLVTMVGVKSSHMERFLRRDHFL